jgi:uncharacterized protein
MRWGDFRRSDNVEDRRGQLVRAGGLGIGATIILGLIAWATGISPSVLIGGAEMVSRHLPQSSTNQGAPNDETSQFVAAVLGDTEDRWTDIFKLSGKTYRAPKLVMFSGATRSACGTAQSAVGPFYCPIDRTVYLDTSFFKQIESRLRGCETGSKACRFSQAYVISHEIGHHVQNELGILPKVQALQARAGQSEANQVQVRVELQADCLAGVWANHSQNKLKFLEPGDIEAALQTATAIGDDTLQKRSQGYVAPDSFTHGSSEQRKRWFVTGLKSGDVASCDTFKNASL